MILEAKTSPPPRFIPLPKINLRGEVYLSPPPLHWVVAPAFNICSDYSRSRNLMLSPRVGIQILPFFVFEKRHFLDPIFVPRRFSLEVSSVLKIAKWAIFKNFYKLQLILTLFCKKNKKIMSEYPKLQGETHFQNGWYAFGATLTDVWWTLHVVVFVWVSMDLKDFCNLSWFGMLLNDFWWFRGI